MGIDPYVAYLLIIFWVLFHDSIAFTVTEYFIYLFCLIKKFYEITVSRNEEKQNHVLKTDGDKLFKDLLENKIFSKQILSWNFKIEFCLNRGLLCKFLGWKLIILIALFVKL